MTERENALFARTCAHFGADAKRIQHFIKVLFFADRIAEGEGAARPLRERLRAAAIVHDAGIVPAERLFGRSDGALQEELGPAEAERLLLASGYTAEEAARICYLVAHHHSYGSIDGQDLQMLIEADFLVNFYEDGVPQSNIAAAVQKLFRTRTGISLAEALYGVRA